MANAGTEAQKAADGSRSSYAAQKSNVSNICLVTSASDFIAPQVLVLPAMWHANACRIALGYIFLCINLQNFIHSGNHVIRPNIPALSRTCRCRMHAGLNSFKLLKTAPNSSKKPRENISYFKILKLVTLIWLYVFLQCKAVLMFMVQIASFSLFKTHKINLIAFDGVVCISMSSTA